MVGRMPWNMWRKEDILEKSFLAWNMASSSHEVSNGTATLSLQWDLYAGCSSNSMLASALLYCLPNKPGQAVLIQTGSFGCFTCIFSFLENSSSPSPFIHYCFLYGILRLLTFPHMWDDVVLQQALCGLRMLFLEPNVKWCMHVEKGRIQVLCYLFIPDPVY